jgi:small subunit ribosomal protein S17
MTAENSSQSAAVAKGSRPRGQRVTEVGVVTSDARDKTIRVTVSYMVRHPKYGKYIRRRTVLHAHDEKNECHTGDRVEVVQCRPLSKTKCWRLLRVLQQAPLVKRSGA